MLLQEEAENNKRFRWYICIISAVYKGKSLIFCQVRVEFAFSYLHSFRASETFNMGDPDIGYYPDIRLSDL